MKNKLTNLFAYTFTSKIEVTEVIWTESSDKQFSYLIIYMIPNIYIQSLDLFF